MLIPHLSESAGPEAVNQTLCSNLSLLFTMFLTELERAISRSGGKLLAEEFEQRINDYAGRHGWRALTGLIQLTDLRERSPDVDGKMLSMVYASYAQHAQTLAGHILGEQLLTATLTSFVNHLPPHLAEINTCYGLVCP
jgi:hypothetical protein